MPAPLPVTFDQFPQSIDSFVSLRDGIAKTPQGGAAMMVVALLLFADNDKLGLQCLVAAIDQGRLMEGSGGYLGWKLGPRDMQLIRMQIGTHPHLPRSYFRGATPENGYELPPPPFVCEFAHNPYSGDPDSGRFKAFIECSGASSPRPVTVQRNDQGLWQVYQWSSLVTGIQRPGQPMP